MQDEIVAKVKTTLGLVLKLNEMRVPREVYSRPTDNLDAFDAYLRALGYMWRGTKDDTEKARRWFDKAIELDPKFAEAYAYLGWTYFLYAVYQWGQNTQAAVARAHELAQKALALDDSSSSALALMTELDLHQGRFERAVADGQRVVAIYPNDTRGYPALSDALASDGKPEEAIRVAENAMRLDPANHAWYAFFLGRPYVDMGRYQEAIPLLKEDATSLPDMLWAHYLLVVAYTELGRDREAQAEAAEVRRISPQFGCKDLFLKDDAACRRSESLCRKAGFK